MKICFPLLAWIALSSISQAQDVNKIADTIHVGVRKVSAQIESLSTPDQITYKILVYDGNTTKSSTSIQHTGASQIYEFRIRNLALTPGPLPITISMEAISQNTGEVRRVKVADKVLPDPLALLLPDARIPMNWDVVTSNAARGMTATQRDKHLLGLRRFAIEYDAQIKLLKKQAYQQLADQVEESPSSE